VRVLTPCAPLKATIGASRPLVRFTVLMSACSRVFPDVEMTIRPEFAEDSVLARLVNVPAIDGERGRLDILKRALDRCLR
jgi:hypothetical protein